MSRLDLSLSHNNAQEAQGGASVVYHCSSSRLLSLEEQRIGHGPSGMMEAERFVNWKPQSLARCEYRITL